MNKVLVEMMQCLTGRRGTRKPAVSLLPRVHVRRRGGESGQAMVEFALVAPLLFLLVVGIIKFGVVYNNYIQLTNAVDSGARLFAIERGQGGVCSAVDANVDAAAGGLNDTTGDLSVTMSTIPATSNDTWVDGVEQTGGSCPTLASGNSATVSASYPCDLTILGIDFFPSCSISARSTEAIA
jgi:Flp pilus assembly protein TadG